MRLEKNIRVFNHKGLVLISQNISLGQFISSYPNSRYESSFQGNRSPPSMSKGGPIALYMPGPTQRSGRRIDAKASTPTKPDQPAKGGSP